jgi:hypothetical protein
MHQVRKEGDHYVWEAAHVGGVTVSYSLAPGVCESILRDIKIKSTEAAMKLKNLHYYSLLCDDKARRCK